MNLEVGLALIRKAGSIHPGPKAARRSRRDWRGKEQNLLLQRAAAAEGDLVLLVDDWVETGSQALAARALLEECGASYVGLSVLVDQLTETRRADLQPLAAVVFHRELPASA